MSDVPVFKRPRGRPPKNPRIETDMETDNIRPSVRDLSPRDAAAQRAAELREHGSAVEDVTDKFYVDPRTIPDGWSYEEWYGVVGQGNGQNSPFERQLRKAYFLFKDDLWKK
jgi:hypothetical protein